MLNDHRPSSTPFNPIALPSKVQFVPDLQKTRSGVIMGSIVQKIAQDRFRFHGDTPTLGASAVVD
jgi:acetyl-CoA synthetase